MRTVGREEMFRWLLEHGFVELPRNSSGHAYFRGYGLKVSLPAHGKKELSPGLVSQLRRMLRGAGVAVDF